MKKINLLYRFDPNFRVILIPFILLTIAFGLLVFSVNKGYSQVNNQIEKLENMDKQEQGLSTKLEILRDIREGLLEYTNASIVAVPDKNPASWSLSSLRRSIYQNSLKINKADLKSQNEGENLNSVYIKFELEGKIKDIIAFASETEEMAPILKIKTMGVSKSKDSFSVDIEIATYWADLPKKLPAIDEPITNLNEGELAILADIKNLFRPDFNVLEPQPDSQRQDPFE